MTRSDCDAPAPNSPGARLPDFLRSPSARRQLRDATVTMVGLGSIGTVTMQQLGRLGVGQLRLVDPGKFKTESRWTHVGPTPTGRYKVRVLADLGRRSFPETSVTPYAVAIEAAPTALLDSDLVLLASDNLGCEITVTESCSRLGIPLIQASVDGETLVCQIRSLANAGPETPCLACGYGHDEWAAAAASRRFSCEGSTTQPATRSPAFLCGIAASLQAEQATLALIGHRGAIADELLEWRGFRNQSVRTRLVRNPDCPLEHARWSHIPAAAPACAQSARQLVTHGTGKPASEDDRLDVLGMRYVAAPCRACQAQRRQSPDGRRRPGRFVTTTDDPGSCESCGRRLDPSFDTSAGVALRDLPAPWRDRPLRALGVHRPTAVTVRSGDRCVLIAQAEDPAGELQ